MRVSGSLTRDGASFSDVDSPRGTIDFWVDRDDNRHRARVALAPRQRDYELRVFADSYNVVMAMAEPWRSAPATLHRGLVFESDTELNLALRTVQVTGELRTSRGPLPDDEILDGHGRGSVYFIRNGESAPGNGRSGVGVALGETGPAHFETTLWAGHYEVGVMSHPAVNQSVLPDALFWSLDDALHLTEDQVLEPFVDIVDVAGEVTARGMTLPDGDTSHFTHRGWVQLAQAFQPDYRPRIVLTDWAESAFHPARVPFIWGFGIDYTGPAHFGGKVYAGTYRASLLTSLADHGVLPVEQNHILQERCVIAP